MTYELHTPDIPENEARRIGQVLVNSFKRKQFRKCMVGACRRSRAVQGHLVSRSWLNEIATSDEVYVFAPYGPLSPFNAASDNDVLAREHVNNALTRYFTCEEHEKLFFPIDGFEPDFSKLENVHLVFYKALLAQLWLENFMERAYRKVSRESPKDEFYQTMRRVHAESSHGLRRYKSKVERCLNPDRCKRCQGGPCRVIEYQMRSIRGESTIAASQCSAGPAVNFRIFSETERHAEFNAICGTTVVPTSQGHVFLYHYFLDEKHLIQRELDHIAAIQGPMLEAYISAILLSDCENIAVRPEFWEGLGERRQRAILDRFHNDLPDIGIGPQEMIDRWNYERMHQTGILPVPNPVQINLFRRTRLRTS